MTNNKVEKSQESKIVRASAGLGKYRVEGTGIIAGEKGLIICILGGETPHIGAISLAIPRPSLRKPSKKSVTSSIFTLIGHKDDEIARPISENVASELNRITVVVAGVHIDKATDQDIRELVANSEKVSNQLIAKLKKLLM